MKYLPVIVISTIGLLTLQHSEARFLNFGVLDRIENTLGNIKDKIKDRLEQKWGAQVVTQASVVLEEPSTIAAEVPDFHFPDEEGANEIPEVTTIAPEDTTLSRRVIEVPLINGGCPAGYRKVGNRCREVFSG